MGKKGKDRKRENKGHKLSDYANMTGVLDTFRRPDRTGWEDAWIGIEPTFQSEKTVKLWKKMSVDKAGEDKYFESDVMLGLEREVAQGIRDRYEEKRKDGEPYCMFATVKLEEDKDQWGVKRQNVQFRWSDAKLEPFTVRISIDPETVEFSIKPVPLVWLYDDRFVHFLQHLVWEVPMKGSGLAPFVAHGGCQFSFSAKTFLGGSLLADAIAYRVNHPEVCLFLMDWPNPDDRALRATPKRLAGFREMLNCYWAGAFHPKAIGVPTPENCYLDRGWGPAPNPPRGLMNPAKGPVGNPREIFQTNFAFGRAVRLNAQYIHPGYWQSAHPKEEGYRPDQIMRYSELNLNRLQIAGERHVKSDTILNVERVPELDASLDIGMLYDEASFEDRGQMGRTSARDFVESVLLDVHHCRYLQAHPHVKVENSILQDMLLINGAKTVAKHGGAKALDRLRRKARKLNLDSGHERIKSDFIEPETLLWEAWKVLPRPQKAAIAHEIVFGLIERVQQASAFDPRPEMKNKDPMRWHRHRVMSFLWAALDGPAAGLKPSDPVARELESWKDEKEKYLERRPEFSPAGLKPPWGDA